MHYNNLSEEEIEELTKELINRSKRYGVKVTTQRILIFQELAKHTKEHPSAEELFEHLKDKVYGLSLSTVYRSLATFEELGLARRIPTPDGKTHYEIANEPHGHFICRNCGKIYDIENIKAADESLKTALKEQGYETDICNYICYGVCPNCQN